MPRGPWMLLDVSYLAYRSFYALGKLSHNDIATSVVYGVLREIIQLQETFETDRMCFCFDLGRPKRCDLLPSYKTSRHSDKDEDKLEILEEIREQIKQLRRDYLPTIGYRNLIWDKGYEADDVIASIVVERPDKEFVIVSSDQDLWQLLGPKVRIWNPHQKRLLTEDTFRDEWGICPARWPDVKAIAGCSTDDIPGVKSVGEKTAAKYLRNELKKGKALEAIRANIRLWTSNLDLVLLPFPGCSVFRLQRDEVTAEGWQDVIDRLGMNSLAAEIPGIPRKRGATFGRHSRPRRK